MTNLPRLCALGGLCSGLLGACATPFDPPDRAHQLRPASYASEPVPRSVYRDEADGDEPEHRSTLAEDADPDEFVRYAMYHSPELEAAYQRWRAAGERVSQSGVLPDPRLSVGFFIEEVETRVGPQRARLGISQAFPWPGGLEARSDAAAAEARAAWYIYKGIELEVTRRVVGAIHELAYLDSAISITEENLALLGSFEEVVRARYRVGSGSHPELIRTQVELGLFDDRLTQLRAMRPTYVARLNAAMNRPSDAAIAGFESLPGRLADAEPAALIETAREANPGLRGLDEQADGQRRMTEAARYAGRPELTVGVDYIVTGEAMNPSTPGSGDDPVMLNFGINLPLWREKYDAGVRESIARRLALGHERTGRANTLSAAIQEAYFDHMDAHRRVGLYERSLIPKARESLRASLAGYQGGEAGFTDLLDTERTLLEFSLAASRARADRGIALARLRELVGTDIPTVRAEDDGTETTP